MEHGDIVIAGGGIIGLSTALELARAGFRVRVIERDRVMSQASWAAAGMLAAEDPENPPELGLLSALSRRLYPEYLNRVEGFSGRLVPLRTQNALQASRPHESFDCKESVTRSPITAEEAQQRIPGLEPGGRSFLWLEEASLDPRDLCAALPLAAAASGVVVEEGTEVLAVDGRNGCVEVKTSAGTRSAGAFVNCCGAWAAAIRPHIPAAEAVEPRKGQMTVVRLEGGTKLHHVLRTPGIYLVPRGDGRVVIGATVERAGYDRKVEAGAVENLVTRAAELWPPIGRARVVESWSGLRPGTADDLPFIGGAGSANCWLATGHFRNGILLAPATGRVMRQLIEGSQPDTALDRFSAERLPCVRE